MSILYEVIMVHKHTKAVATWKCLAESNTSAINHALYRWRQTYYPIVANPY